MLVQIIETIEIIAGCLLGGVVIASPFLACWWIDRNC